MPSLPMVCALLARVLLMWQGSGDWLAKRIEISTPVNSWHRSKQHNTSSPARTRESWPSIPVQEGIALAASNHSPYGGDVFHEVCTIHHHTCTVTDHC